MGVSLSILNYESYHYALICEMTKEHGDHTVLVPGLSGLLMDRWCIQILIVNGHSPFYYIESNFKLWKYNTNNAYF